MFRVSAPFLGRPRAGGFSMMPSSIAPDTQRMGYRLTRGMSSIYVAGARGFKILHLAQHAPKPPTDERAPCPVELETIAWFGSAGGCGHGVGSGSSHANLQHPNPGHFRSLEVKAHYLEHMLFMGSSKYPGRCIHSVLTWMTQSRIRVQG